ncbi:riboflavin synthase [Flammeovirga pacifica]|uniref:Riboflavin synthase n=1 Tax=Flammeovirga pacifica TaxID=915059 RepID=A0A1S1Z203_FLAPC|nr:riboflavin synthase [Flammeovirga pacifica]OHX67135.1 riboflavin synthase subunit alpha [Flammeovirga pacifica]
MFTGIIEALGKITDITKDQENTIFTVESPISHELKIDQSLAHNGVCLTVTHIDGQKHQVVAIHETLQKTNLGDWTVGDVVNLERSMPSHGRFDGHIVQGHVDQIGECINVQDEQGSWRFTFEYDASTKNFTVEKGSICVNGASLTVVDDAKGQFSVAIIPYTYENTNFHKIKKGTKINLEFDILGKYIQKLKTLDL